MCVVGIKELFLVIKIAIRDVLTHYTEPLADLDTILWSYIQKSQDNAVWNHWVRHLHLPNTEDHGLADKEGVSSENGERFVQTCTQTAPTAAEVP